MAAEPVPPGAGPIVEALHAAAHVAPRSAARLGLWVAEAAIRLARMHPGKRHPRWVADVDRAALAVRRLRTMGVEYGEPE